MPRPLPGLERISQSGVEGIEEVRGTGGVEARRAAAREVTRRAEVAVWDLGVAVGGRKEKWRVLESTGEVLKPAGRDEGGEGEVGAGAAGSALGLAGLAEAKNPFFILMSFEGGGKREGEERTPTP